MGAPGPLLPSPCAGQRLGRPRECFKNAWVLAERDPSLTYVEGYASHIIPCHHAWCINERGEVVDPTWRRNPKLADAWDAREYFGIPFKADYVRRLQLHTRMYGVLYVSEDVLVDDPTLYLAEVTKIPVAIASSIPDISSEVREPCGAEGDQR